MKNLTLKIATIQLIYDMHNLHRPANFGKNEFVQITTNETII